MIAIRPSVAALSGLMTMFACASITEVRAESRRDFQGAWAAESFECRDVFVTKGGKAEFKTTHDNMLPGFIVSGDRIRGKTASCTLSSLKRSGDGFAALLNCETLIMFGTMSVSVHMKNADTLERFDPSFPEMRETYHRCAE